jgi:tetratricopeptide (TPR) repeat protein
MKKSEGWSLLLKATLAGLFIGSAIMTASASWGCYGYGCNYPTSAQVQQHLWDIEAYRFLYCDQCYSSYVPIYPTYQYITPTSSQILENGTSQYWQAKGDELYLAGSYEKAAAAYSEAVKLDPYLADCWLNLGNSLYFLGKYQEALNSYNAALALNPQNENALQGKTQSLLALNRTTEANAAQKSLNALKNRNILNLGSTHNTVVVGDH